MIRRPPRSTQSRSSAASDVYKRQILYDPWSRRAFTFSNHTKGATAVDGATGKAVGSIDLGGKPEAATADGKGHIFVNIEDRDVVIRFDSRKLLATARWKLDPCHEPAS